MNTKFYLPCEFEKKLKCTQGNGGGTSHKGKAYYAYDFISPETANFNICAVADGVVKLVRDSYSKGGVLYTNKKIDISKSAKKYPANYILIYHAADSCYSLYYHIAHKSAKFKAGENVKHGEIIAKAGSVGVSTGVHLHFQIQKAKSSWGQSIAFKFEENASILKGKTYTSQNKRNIFAANYHSQASYPKLTTAGPPQEWWIEFKNTGNIVWENHNKNNRIVKLGLGTYSHPDIQEGRELKCDWESPTRLAVVEQEIVQPGEIGRFSFQVKAASTLKPGKYKLQVTPKSPAGWLKQDDGNELNCFVEIEVAEQEKIGDLFSTEKLVDVHTQCRAPDEEIFPYENSTGLQDFVVPNGDIQLASWDKRRCYHGDNVKMLVKCHEGIPDGSVVEIKVFEADSISTDDIVKEKITGIINNLKCEIPFKADWMDNYEIEGSQYEFYFTATLQGGDVSPAKSKFLYVYVMKFFFI
ncbi:hypothetical protein MHK_003596 [Candidatus Magnetomorum sp. HK-1]|nr:hypothetical protein MHK_003596 [Candidatus Magnetomorum sp. HK-1]